MMDSDLGLPSETDTRTDLISATEALANSRKQRLEDLGQSKRSLETENSSSCQRAVTLSLARDEVTYGGSMSLNLTAPCEFSRMVKRQGASLPSTR
jgi:hypothetical protein